MNTTSAPAARGRRAVCWIRARKQQACRSGLLFTTARSRSRESLNFSEWSGYYAVSAYEAHHEHEYNAIRNASALIDVSPLFKYHHQRA